MPGFAHAVAVAILIGLPLYGTRRGSAPMLCIGAALIVGAMLTHGLALPLSTILPLGGQPDTNASLGLWRLLLLVPVFVAAFPVGAYLHRYIIFTFDPFDFLAGLLVGVVVAGLFTQQLLGAWVMAVDGSPAQELLADSVLVRQLVYGDGWRAFFAWMTHLRENSVQPGQPEINSILRQR